MSEDLKPEKLPINKDVIIQLQLNELQMQNIQLRKQILLIENLNFILDPDHIYIFDFKERVFLKTKIEPKKEK